MALNTSTPKSGQNPRTVPPYSRPTSELLKGRLVVGSGLTSNSYNELIDAIQWLNRTLEKPHAIKA